MFKSPWRSVMWSGAFVLLLLSLVTPFSFLTLSFLILPFLFLYVTLERRAFIIHVAVTLAVIFLLTGGMGSVLIAIFFLVPAIVMGYMYNRQYPAHIVIFTGIMTIIVEILLSFTVASMAGMNTIAEAEVYMRGNLSLMKDVMGPQFDEALIDDYIFLMTQLIPMFMIVFAVYFSLITHWLGRLTLKQAGFELPSLPPVRTWTLPKTVVWLYIGLMLINFLFDTRGSSMLTMAMLNLVFILTIAFCVQGVSFLYHVVHVKGWNKALPIVGIVVCLYNPTLFSMLGVFDIIFDLRSKIQGNNQRGQER